MYDSEGKTLGAATVAVPALLGIGVPASLVIYGFVALVLLLTAFYGAYKYRNRKRPKK